MSQDYVQPALDAVRGSMVPAVPTGFHLEPGDVTELTFYSGIGYQVIYSWGFRSPRGYESLGNFSNVLQRWACVHEYLGYGRKLDMYITSDALLDLAGRKIFSRGNQYFESGCVIDLYAVEEELHATVRGTDVYPVRLWVEDDELHYQCRCPMGKRALCCKHVVAAGLAWETEM